MLQITFYISCIEKANLQRQKQHHGGIGAAVNYKQALEILLDDKNVLKLNCGDGCIT